MPNADEFARRTEPFRSELWRTATGCSGRRDEADDLVQETYLRAWRAYGTFEGPQAGALRLLTEWVLGRLRPTVPRHCEADTGEVPRKHPVPADLLVHLRRARDLADRHYAQPWDLQSLADVAGVSKFHFLRSFSAEYGLTPAEYLCHRRIERAQDLLRATNLTVTEICHLVGFSSLGSFSARFRELVGTTPSEYQARYAESGAPRIPGCYVFMHGLSDRKPVDGSRAILEKRTADDLP